MTFISLFSSEHVETYLHLESWALPFSIDIGRGGIYIQILCLKLDLYYRHYRLAKRSKK
jgi:hypothetical protein